MVMTLHNLSFPRSVEAVSSKSIAHRMLICAAFCSRSSHFKFRRTGSDILRTLNCLSALGCNIKQIAENDSGVLSCYMDPIKELPTDVQLDCGDSGSTLRFMLPIVGTLGINATYVRNGRLADRPLAPLDAMLGDHGVRVYTDENGLLHSEGKLTGTEFEISGEVSSQFISGMLFAMSLMEEPTTLTITGHMESTPYVLMTASVLEAYGVEPQIDGQVIHMPGTKVCKLHRPRCYMAEGDWSGAAAFLCAGAIGTHPVRVNGLKLRTAQGDRKIMDILREFGAKLSKEEENSLTVTPGRLHGIEIDAKDVPDLIPVVASVAVAATGLTTIKNAGRLRLKESDRLSAIAQMLKAVGVIVREWQDGLEILGGKTIHGATINAYHDHRIAMAASLLALQLPKDQQIKIIDAESVSKSWPGYWADLEVEHLMTEN